MSPADHHGEQMDEFEFSFLFSLHNYDFLIVDVFTDHCQNCGKWALKQI